MPVSTYEAIGSFTTSANLSQVTLSNIPQTYTDLVLVTTAISSATGADIFTIVLNGDNNSTGTNYSFTGLYATGTAAGSYRSTNQPGFVLGNLSTNSSFEWAPSVFNFNNYSNNTSFKNVLVRSNSATTSGLYTDLSVGTWRQTGPINTITLRTVNGYGIKAGSTFNLYGIGANTVKASGGDVITTDGTYWYHAFKTSGVFTPNSTLSCDVLVVAGGGAGGSSQSGAAYQGTGGGAGGVVYSAANSVSTAKTITVGAGGLGVGQTYPFQGGSGSNSTFQGLTAAVGGGGGIYYGVTSQGINGGSGGGGGGQHNTPAPGLGTSGQGNNGGVGVYAGGGGGGAGAVGGNSGWSAANAQAGVGGAGVNTYSAWLNTTNTGVAGFIAGGGGGGFSDGYGTPTNYLNGGSGGGGVGGSGGITTPAGISAQQAGAGVANTGSGGGGGGANTNTSYAGGFNGGNGGSGIVIVRYAV